jgi:hypothetical protein
VPEVSGPSWTNGWLRSPATVCPDRRGAPEVIAAFSDRRHRTRRHARIARASCAGRSDEMTLRQKKVRATDGKESQPWLACGGYLYAGITHRLTPECSRENAPPTHGKYTAGSSSSSPGCDWPVLVALTLHECGIARVCIDLVPGSRFRQRRMLRTLLIN